MKKALLTSLAIIVAVGAVIEAQTPQQERFKRRARQSSIRAAMEEQQAAQDQQSPAEPEGAPLPQPKPAVTNVDVRAVVTKKEYKTFAEASADPVKKILDGEPLWMYLKFKTKLGDYVLTTRHPDDPEKLRYSMFVEIGPHDDVTALSQYTIQFTKEDLAATEFRIALSPALFGYNKSMPVFLTMSSAAKPGVWNNEFRLTNSTAFPKVPTSSLAIVPVTLDFGGGVTKYKKQAAEYDSIVLRGTTDISKLPVAGTFFSESVSAAVLAKLAADNITPTKIYFSGDDWQEFGAGGFPQTRARKIFATFTYRNGESCLYGLAEVVQKFNYSEAKFGESEISIQKGLATECSPGN